MHYEDLIIKALKVVDGSWNATLMSSNCCIFTYPVADSSFTEEQLAELGIYVGRNLLGYIKEDRLISIDGLDYMESKTKKR